MLVLMYIFFHRFFQYGGNPVSCAIALAVMNVIKKEKLREHAVETGGYCVEKCKELMEKHQIIGDVR